MIISAFCALSLLVTNAAFAANQGIAYQGRILKSDGQPLQASAVQFIFTVMDPSSNCVLYSEAATINMTGSQGNFALPIGTGTRVDGGSHTWKQVFTNAGTLSSLNCGSGSTYSPTASDERVLKVTFNDGTGVQPLNPMTMRAAPFALQADQVGGYSTINLAKISGAGSANTFTPNQHDFLFNLSAAGSASNTPCATGEILKYNGTAWACAADATGGSPGDASYAAKGIVQFNTDAATSGVSVVAGVATINTGIGANQIAKFDASANLGVGIAPTTRLDVNGAITQRGMAAPAVSAAGTGRVYFDSTSNKFRVSENTGAYVDLLSGATSLTGDVSGTSSTTSVDKIKGTAVSITALTTGNFLKYNGTNWINTLLGASDIPALDAAKITTGVLPVANGGTGASSIGSGNIVVGAGTGAVTSLASGATGNVIYGSGASSWLSGTPDTAGIVDKTSVQAISGAKTFGATVKMSNQNLLTFGDSGSNTASIKAPAAVTTSYTLTMPPALPGSNKVLQSDNAGVLSWVAAGGGGDALTTNPLSQFAATTSAQLAGVLNDETGTGLAVFNTSPTFATNITSPMIVGGTGTTSTLTYKATSGVGAAGADHVFQVGNNGATEAMRILNNGNVGIGTTAPSSALQIISSIGPQAKIGSGLNKYLSVSDDGANTIDIQGYNNGNTNAITMTNLGAGAASIALKSRGTTVMTLNDSGNVGIGTTSPVAGLDVASSLSVSSGLSPVLTTLNGAINSSVATLTVASTANYPSSGTLGIDTESMTYTGKTATTFTGVTRGAFGTTAGAHGNGTTIYGVVASFLANGSAGQYGSALSVYNNESVIIGVPSYPYPLGSTSLGVGYNVNPFGNNSLSVGMGSSSASYSIGVGAGASAMGNSSQAMGYNVTSPAFAEFVSGQYNLVTGTETSNSWVASDPLFVIGNGTSAGAKSNAVTVLKNGNVGIGTTASPSARLEVSSGVADTSGLKFTNFTSTAPTGTGQPLGVDASGNLITIASGGGGSVTGVTATAPVASSGGTAPVISMAAATTSVDGYLKATDFTIFNNKLGTASTFVGDISGTSGATSVDKIKGTGVAITALTTGNFFRYNGTNWVNTNLVAADIPSLDASKIASGVLSVANGGTGASSMGSGNIVVGGGTGAATSLASGATGNVIYGSGASSWLSGTPDTAGLVDKTSVQAISGAKTFGATIKMSNQNLLSLGDTGSNAVSLRAPATVTSSYTLTMPAAQGGASTVLTNDGSGNLSWAAGGGGGLPAAAGTAAAPAYAFSGNTNTGMFGAATNQIGFAVNGAEKLRVDASGNVGIGTAAPSTTLDVNGPITMRQAYFESVGALGTISGTTNITAFTTNVYTLTLSNNVTSTMNIPTVTGFPSGSSQWSVSFYVTGSPASIFNVSYNNATTNVFWDANSTGSNGGTGYAGFLVPNGHTDLITCTVLNTGTVNVYCGISAQY